MTTKKSEDLRQELAAATRAHDEKEAEFVAHGARRVEAERNGVEAIRKHDEERATLAAELAFRTRRVSDLTAACERAEAEEDDAARLAEYNAALAENEAAIATAAKEAERTRARIKSASAVAQEAEVRAMRINARLPAGVPLLPLPSQDPRLNRGTVLESVGLAVVQTPINFMDARFWADVADPAPPARNVTSPSSRSAAAREDRPVEPGTGGVLVPKVATLPPLDDTAQHAEMAAAPLRTFDTRPMEPIR